MSQCDNYFIGSDLQHVLFFGLITSLIWFKYIFKCCLWWITEWTFSVSAHIKLLKGSKTAPRCSSNMTPFITFQKCTVAVHLETVMNKFFSGIEHLMIFKESCIRKITHELMTQLAPTAPQDWVHMLAEFFLKAH